MAQLGFFIRTERCVQCHACEVACKSWNGIEPGVRWRRVLQDWGGAYPEVADRTISVSCMHCEKPACAAVCPAGAISKRAEDGVVTVDRNKCIGCRSCSEACPYGVPQYGKNGRMQKCDLCLERAGVRRHLPRGSVEGRDHRRAGAHGGAKIRRETRRRHPPGSFHFRQTRRRILAAGDPIPAKPLRIRGKASSRGPIARSAAMVGWRPGDRLDDSGGIRIPERCL